MHEHEKDAERGYASGPPRRIEAPTQVGYGARRTFEGVVRSAAWTAIVIALATLLGWLLDFEVLRQAGRALPANVPLAGLCLLALGSSLVLVSGHPSRRASWMGHGLAGAAAVLALMVLLQHILEWDAGIDRVLFPGRLAETGEPTGGRVQPAAAFALFLLGTALALYGHRAAAVHRAAEILVLAGFLVALGTLFRYAFDPRPDPPPVSYDAMPLPMAVALLVLAAGTALSRPDRGRFRILGDPGAAGVALRRLIPVSIAGPFLMGWLTYTAAANNVLSPLASLTAFMSAMCLLLLAAVGWTTRELERIDRERLALLRSEQAARAEAEEASVARARFLGFISHELRTPMNAVLAYVDLLEAGMERGSIEDQRRHVDRIRASGTHLRSMIDEILRFTRSRTAELEIEVREVDAVEIAREALEAVQHEIDPEVLEIHLQLPQSRIPARTDPEKVLHVLVNLLGNAIKFTRRGKVGLRVTASDGRLTYEVWDSGPGISREDRERIFQDFTQLGERDGRGVGLGLAICRNYASALGGHLELESWVGRGSIFRLVLPLEKLRRRASWRSRPMIRLAR